MFKRQCITRAEEHAIKIETGDIRADNIETKFTQ